MPRVIANIRSILPRPRAGGSLHRRRRTADRHAASLAGGRASCPSEAPSCSWEMGILARQKTQIPSQRATTTSRGTGILARQKTQIPSQRATTKLPRGRLAREGSESTSWRLLAWRLLSVAFRSSDRTGWPLRVASASPFNDRFDRQRPNPRKCATLCHARNTYPAGWCSTDVLAHSDGPATTEASSARLGRFCKLEGLYHPILMVLLRHLRLAGADSEPRSRGWPARTVITEKRWLGLRRQLPALSSRNTAKSSHFVRFCPTSLASIALVDARRICVGFHRIWAGGDRSRAVRNVPRQILESSHPISRHLLSP
jgi:hypothetical protein